MNSLKNYPAKFATEQLKPIADMIISCCEDPDQKIREQCTNTLVVLGSVVRSRGRAAIDAHRVIMGK